MKITDLITEEDLPAGVSEFRTGEAYGMNPSEGEIASNRLLQDEDMGWFMKTMDYLARGNYGMANMTMNAMKKKGKKAFMASLLTGPAALVAEGSAEAFVEGFKGEKKTTFVDVMEELVPGRHPWVEKPMGFALDVVVDPINLVPMAWFGKVGKLLKLDKVLKSANEVSGATKYMKKAGMVLSDLPVIDQLGKAFKPGWELRKVPGAYKMYRDLQLHLQDIRRAVKLEFTENWDLFRKVAKGLGEDPAEAASKLIDLREAGRAAEVLPEFRPFYDYVVKGLEKVGKEETEAGILKNIIKDYFPHIYEKGKVVIDPKTGRRYTKKQKGFYTGLAYRQNISHTKIKKWKTLEDARMNLLKWQKVDGFADEIAPVDNWFRGYAIRRFTGESALAWKGFIDDALKQFGEPLTEVISKKTGKSLEEIKKLSNDEWFKLFPEYIKLDKGKTFVTSTANLRSPKMKKLFGQLLEETMRQRPTAFDIAKADLAHAFKDSDLPDVYYNIFKKMKGKGLHVDLSLDDIAQMKGEGVHLFPAEFAKEVKNTFKVFGTDSSIKEFSNTYNKALHAWKTMATSMRVAFHTRNAVSNTWLMYLSGVDAPMIPKRIAEAAMIQLKKGKINGFSSEELLAMADRYGIRAYGWVSADIPTMFQRELSIIEKRSKAARIVGVGDQPWNPLQPVARAGRKVGTYIEDNSRLAVMIDQIKKRKIFKEVGKGEEHLKEFSDIAEHVKKYLFDYTELTELERKVMKRGIPFYTWMRKNIPLQLESLIKQPHKYARYGDFERDMFPLFAGDTMPTPMEQQITPHWMKESQYRKTSWTTSAGDSIYYKVDMPQEDLHKMMHLKTWLSALTPAYTMLNIAANVRHWPTGGKIAEPGQYSTAPWYVQLAPEWMHKAADIRPGRTKEGKSRLVMNPQWKFALQTAFPFLNDWEKAYPGMGELSVREKAGKGWAALSYATGIKFRPLSKEDQALNKHFMMMKINRDIRRAAKKLRDFNAEDIKKIIEKNIKGQ